MSCLAQDYTGLWKGKIYQEGNREYYLEFRVDSLDKDGNMSGTTYIKEEASGNFGTILFTGKITGSSFSFKESAIVKEVKDSEGYYESNMFYWCIKHGTVKISSNDKQWRLSGPWTAEGTCPGGTLDVWKDKPPFEPEIDCNKLESADFMLGAWRGKFHQHSCGVNGIYPMVVLIDRVEGMKFYGMFIWTNMQFAEDSRSTLEGEIKNGKIYFYENKIISGSGLVLNGIYKSTLIDCDKLTGYWYRDYQSKTDCPEMKPFENGGDYDLTHYEIPTIYFGLNSSELRPKSIQDLNEFVQFLKDFPSLKFNIKGHTDDSGSNANNLVLSKKRAQIVIDYIVSKGISAKRFSYTYHAQALPATPNSSEENMQLNRRTEILIK